MKSSVDDTPPSGSNCGVRMVSVTTIQIYNGSERVEQKCREKARAASQKGNMHHLPTTQVTSATSPENYHQSHHYDEVMNTNPSMVDV